MQPSSRCRTATPQVLGSYVFGLFHEIDTSKANRLDSASGRKIACDAVESAKSGWYTASEDRLISCRFLEPVGPGVGDKIAVDVIDGRLDPGGGEEDGEFSGVVTIGCAPVFSAERASTRKAPSRRRNRREISLFPAEQGHLIP